ncbi:MAG: hypothetical protein ACI94Y_000141 [Maribacter sp.]|jgi:hypothetical protein
MNKKKNYNILEPVKYIQCIVKKVIIKMALFHKIEIVESEIKELKIKDSDCREARITKSDFSRSVWKSSNLLGVQIQDCNIEGLRIDGHLVSELIKERESNTNRY